MSVARPTAATLLAIGAVLTLGVAGCSQTGDGFDLARILGPREGQSTPAPTPDSPAAALRLFEWSYNNKAFSEYRELFTADFRFYFHPLDSAGAAYRDTAWTRDDELISTLHLFVGGSTSQPPARSIRLTLDRNFFVAPDPRISDPEGRWHKNVRTEVVLNVQLGDGNAIDISGAANFYLVRGDSAMIPIDLIARGFRPDSSRWWIARWDDETAQGEPAPNLSLAGAERGVARRPTPLAAQPATSRTWGSLKKLYR